MCACLWVGEGGSGPAPTGARKNSGYTVLGLVVVMLGKYGEKLLFVCLILKINIISLCIDNIYYHDYTCGLFIGHVPFYV